MRKGLFIGILKIVALLLIMSSLALIIIASNLPKTYGYVRERDFNVFGKVFRTSVYLYGNDSLKMNIVPKSEVRGILLVNISHLDEVKLVKLRLNGKGIVLRFIADKPGIYNITMVFPNTNNTNISEYYVRLEAVGGSKNGYQLYYLVYSMIFLVSGLIMLSIAYYGRLVSSKLQVIGT